MSEPWYDQDPDEEPRGQFDLDAERAVLGALMKATPEQIDEISRIVAPHQFHKPAHQEIAQAVYEYRERDEPTDATTIMRYFQTTRRLNAIGGPGYLVDLLTNCPGVEFGTWHAEAIRGFANLREIENLGVWLRGMGTNPGTDPDDIPELLDTAIKRLDTVRTLIPGKDKPFVGELLPAVLARAAHPDETTSIATGFSDLDAVYGGHKPGQLTVIGARPSVGKTIIGVDFARHAAIKLGIPTLFASLEMSAGEIMARILSAQSRVNHTRILKGQCDNNDWDRIARTIGPIADAPLCIDDTPKQSLSDLAQTARSMRRGRGLGLIIVDYLQIMTPPKAESRHKEVGRTAEGLKELAHRLEIPIVALAQLNRDVDKRSVRKPQMADLRESGEIEAHANNIFLLHREDLYEKESPRAGEMDVLIQKQRDGQTGEVTLSFQGHYARCQSMAAEWTPGGNLPNGRN